MSNGILVLCEHADGAFKKTAYELLAKAGQLAQGAPVTAAVIGAGPDASKLGAYGASKVYTVSGGAFDTFGAGKHARALQAILDAAQPAVVLAPASPDVNSTLPRLAARLNLGMATECTDLSVDGGAVVGRRPMYAGKAFADVRVSSTPAFFSVRPNSFPVPEAGAGAAAVVAVAATVQPSDEAAKVTAREASASTVADLTEADRIVSGGRSVKTKDGYDGLIRPLASTLGATPGASRACVDAGYAPHSHQVGQTGKVVNPSLYIAMGISGAIQHLAGMRTSRVIVAVNTDPEAPIFQHATYGIVADMFEVGPALQKELEQALS